MADNRRAHCQNCGKHRSEVGEISWRGKCHRCGHEVLNANIDGLHFKTGVPWQRWRFGQVRSLLGSEAANALYAAGVFSPPLDDALASEQTAGHGSR